MSELFLSKELYGIGIINRACIDYKELSDISIIDAGAYYKIVFQNCKYSDEVTMKEFENYVIDLTGKK